MPAIIPATATSTPDMGMRLFAWDHHQKIGLDVVSQVDSEPYFRLLAGKMRPNCVRQKTAELALVGAFLLAGTIGQVVGAWLASGRAQW